GCRTLAHAHEIVAVERGQAIGTSVLLQSKHTTKAIRNAPFSNSLSTTDVQSGARHIFSEIGLSLDVILKLRR
ncbi:MAG: hypothetical protein ACI9BW_004647, partial [Gammaproteobacteria bacterium]